MTLDWDALLYDPLYAIYGKTAVLTPVVGAAASFTVIDRTQGIELASAVELPTIVPACFIRRAELDTAGLTEQELLGGALSMNGNVWTVSDIKARPGPDGKNSGEIILVLIAQAGSA